MKTRIAAVLVALVVLAAALATGASAATEHHSSGKLTKFSYTKSTKVGHVTLTKNHVKTKYRIPADATCGVNNGGSGDQIPCKSLGKDKYHGKTVEMTWTKKNADGVRVVSLASVNM
jgi:hypothetical protein